MTWTDETTKKLVDLHALGFSASHMSRALGDPGRNAVLGKLFRMGLCKRKPNAEIQPDKNRPIRPDRVHVVSLSPSVVKPTPAMRLPPAMPKPKPKARAKVPPRPATIVTILQLSEKTCRFPIGDPLHKDFTFCGHAPQRGSPYCEGHVAMTTTVYTRPAPHLGRLMLRHIA